MRDVSFMERYISSTPANGWVRGASVPCAVFPSDADLLRPLRHCGGFVSMAMTIERGSFSEVYRKVV